MFPLECVDIEQTDAVANVLQHAFPLEPHHPDRNGGTSYPEHDGKKVLRQRELRRSGAVGAEQQPPCQPLTDVVLRIARGRLGRLGQLHLDIPQGKLLKLASKAPPVHPRFLRRSLYPASACRSDSGCAAHP